MWGIKNQMFVRQLGLAIFLLASVPWADQASSQDPSSNSANAAQILSLGDQDENVRATAIKTLAEQGEEIVPLLIEAFASTDVHVREGAIAVLYRIGETTIPAILGSFSSDSALVRATAARAFVLTEFGDSHQYREALGSGLLNAIGDEDPIVRKSAAQALWEYEDENAKPYLPNGLSSIETSLILEQLSDPDQDIRREALDTLSDAVKMDPLDYERHTVAKFAPLLQDDDPIVRKVAVWMLGQVSALDQKTIEEVMALLEDPSRGVRAAAAITVSRFDAYSVVSSERLRLLLDDSDDLVRGSAAIALVTLGIDDEKVVHALRGAARYLDEDLREDAALALAALGPQAITTVPILRRLLDDVFPEVKSAAALALGQIGEAAVDAVPELREALSDHNATVRAQSARSLGRIGPGAASAVPELRKALKDKNPSVRAAAARSLSQIGYEADIAMTDLRFALDDSSQLVRKFSAEALARIAVAIGEAAPNLDAKERRAALKNLTANEEILTAAVKNDAGNSMEYGNALVATGGAIRAIETVEEVRGRSLVTVFAIWMLGYVVGMTTLSLLVLAMCPIWLFKLNQVLEPLEFFVPRALGNNQISMRHLLIVGFFYTHPRVLVAWVKSNLAVARTSFDSNPRVKSHVSFAQLPMKLEGENFSLQEIERLHQTFQQRPSCLLVHGECGAGKTNFAIQLARKTMDQEAAFRLTKTPMLSVLIDNDLHKVDETTSSSSRRSRSRNVSEPNIDPLVEAVRGQLQELTRSRDPVSHRFLNALLRSQSLLVIIDGMSELNELSRQLIRPELPEFLINALVITSRDAGILRQVAHTSLSLDRITATSFSTFLNAAIGARSNEIQFDAAAQDFIVHNYSEIVGMEGAPALFARIFCDQWLMSTVAIDGEIESTPKIETECFQRFVADICARHSRLSSFRTVWDDAGTLSLSCILGATVPETVPSVNATSVLGGDEPEVRLRNLERRLSITQTVPPSFDEIKFSIPMLPAHLAAIRVFRLRDEQPQLWVSTLTAAREGSSKSEVRRIFLRSVEQRLGRPISDTDLVPQTK